MMSPAVSDWGPHGGSEAGPTGGRLVVAEGSSGVVRHHARRARWVLSGVLLLVGVGGCRDGEPGDPGSAEVPDATGSMSTALSASAPTVVAEHQAEDAQLRVQILELERVGANVLRLHFAFVNDSPANEVVEFGAAFAPEAGDADSVAGVHLVDVPRQKKYFVLRETSGQPLCSRDLVPLAPGDRVELWATFPAPSQEAEAIMVVIPTVRPFEAIPIT